MKLSKRVDEVKGPEFSFRNGVLWFRDRLCVPNILELKKKLPMEAHDLSPVTYPGSTKMYQDLKRYYWWIGMKRNVTVNLA